MLYDSAFRLQLIVIHYVPFRLRFDVNLLTDFVPSFSFVLLCDACCRMSFSRRYWCASFYVHPHPRHFPMPFDLSFRIHSSPCILSHDIVILLKSFERRVSCAAFLFAIKCDYRCCLFHTFWLYPFGVIRHFVQSCTRLILLCVILSGGSLWFTLWLDF